MIRKRPLSSCVYSWLANANVYLYSFLWILINEAIGEAAKAKGRDQQLTRCRGTNDWKMNKKLIHMFSCTCRSAAIGVDSVSEVAGNF